MHINCFRIVCVPEWFRTHCRRFSEKFIRTGASAVHFWTVLHKSGCKTIQKWTTDAPVRMNFFENRRQCVRNHSGTQTVRKQFMCKLFEYFFYWQNCSPQLSLSVREEGERRHPFWLADSSLILKTVQHEKCAKGLETRDILSPQQRDGCNVFISTRSVCPSASVNFIQNYTDKWCYVRITCKQIDF